MGRGRPALCLVVVLSGSALGRAAGAQTGASAGPQPLDLTWEAPPECPSRDAVLASVYRLAGAPSEATDRRVSAHASVYRGEDARWHVHVVTLGDTGGERALEAGSCEALADAVAVVLALRVQPSLLLEPQPPPPPATPPEPAPPVPQTPRPASIAPAAEVTQPPSEPAPGATPPGGRQPPRHPVSAYVGASALGELGSLPSLAPGGEIQAGVGTGRLRLEAFAASGPKQTAVAPVGSASIGVLRGGLRPCYGLPLGRWTVAGCGVAEVDWMWADGAPGPGIATARSQSAGWVGLGAGVQGRWAMSRRFALRMSVEGLIPTQRRRFVTEASSTGSVVDDVHDPSVVWGRAELGVEATIF